MHELVLAKAGSGVAEAYSKIRFSTSQSRSRYVFQPDHFSSVFALYVPPFGGGEDGWDGVKKNRNRFFVSK